ncbi:nucleotidyltransferase [Lactococcus petauri]|uniref:nucleotidyltransferase n=1 Tax=Lactococcus petauri TaxID=1940789 RepID=UPI0013FD88B3|nr:nucleotidyltransferase [Lactococcus petauri]NHI76361.1 nucleotidyltransferase [Lactococcus petauri]
MQKIIGIVAEFNPFHNGHKYLLDQAGDGIKIVAMSGNFMQRGEPALFDKWTRAEMALKNGADIVVELPVMGAVQAADFFAQAAVDILDKMGIGELVFGSESTLDYQKIVNLYEEKSTEMENFIKDLPDTLSYPEKTQMMWQKFSGLHFDGNTPNHVLALAYAKASAGKDIRLQAIQRSNDFHSRSLSGEIASATAIRANIDQQDILNFVPENLKQLYQHPRVSWDNYFTLLKYKIISHDLSLIFQMNTELESRIKTAIKQVNTVDELIEAVHTKRYTRARVRRLLTYVLLDIPRDFQLPQNIHVLGFTKQGQQHLAKVKDKLVTRIGKESWDLLTQKSDDIYQLGNHNFKEQNHGRKPLIL